MTTEKAQLATHVHIWLINRRNIGTCSLCGEIRQFPWYVKTPITVLKTGNHGTIQVPEKDHSSIKQVSKREGHMSYSNMDRHKYYEKHKEDILADLRFLGRPATRGKWGIPSGTMNLLEKRWLTQDEIQVINQRSTPGGKPTTRKQLAAPSTTGNNSNNLPSFPKFSNEWAESVQLKWFEVYEQLRSI